MRLLVALDVVRLVLVPVVVRRRLALRRRQVGPNAGRVRSVSLANLVLDRPGHLDRPPDVLRLNELRFLGDRDVARGSDEAAELPEPQAQPLVLVVQRLCTPSGLVDHDPDRIARRGRNALVDRNLLRDELHELRAVDVGVRHRRLDEHLVSGTRDPRARTAFARLGRGLFAGSPSRPRVASRAPSGRGPGSCRPLARTPRPLLCRTAVASWSPDPGPGAVRT